jgi:hypothetical protein
MTFEEILEQYEINKNLIKQNDNSESDFDLSQLGIKFDTTGTDFNPDRRTRRLEEKTIQQLQDVFDQYGLELKNATNGIYYDGLLLVEHHQHKKIENEIVPSGILTSIAGYWWFGIDDIGFIVLKREFLLWVYENNKTYKWCKDEPIPSQSSWNTGHAIYIRYSQLPHLMKLYKEHLQTI